MTQLYPSIVGNVGTIINNTSQIIQQAGTIVGGVSEVAVKGVAVVNKFADEMIDEMRKREEERKKEEIAKSTYESPAYDEEELVEMFKKAKEKGLDYIVIKSDEIKPKTIELMQKNTKVKYRFTDPTMSDIEEARPDFFQTCCFVKKIDLSQFIRVSFSVF